jgi:hypothetical protein
VRWSAALTAVLAIALGLCPLRSASAEPEIVVKARASLTELLTVARGLRVDVEGNLRDNLGQPVAGAEVEIRVGDAAPQAATTDAQGHFRATLLSQGTGARSVEVRFLGSALLGTAAAAGEVTIGRAEVELQLRAPEATAAGGPVDLSVRAVDRRGTPRAGLSLQVALDAQQLQALPTDTNGEIHLTARDLGRGTHRFVVTFAGDDDHLPARVEQPLTAFVTPVVTLEALPPRLEPGTVLMATGRVDGAPGEALPVVLTADGEPIGGSTTDAQGRFALTLASDSLPTGKVEVRVLVAPTEPSLRTAFSAAQRVEVIPPPPPSPAWFVAPAAIGALAAFAAAWRRRPTPLAPSPVPPRAPPPPPFARRAPPVDDGLLRIEVRAEATGAPVQARVRLLGSEIAPSLLRPPPPGPATETDAEGRAVIAGPGTWLWTEAEGFAPDGHACHVPPGGHVVIHLQTPRARVQARHEAVLAAAGRPVLRFGRETPAQSAADLLRRGAPAALVRGFTEAVERGCFGAEAPDHALLAAVEADAVRLTEGFRRGRFT